MEKEIVIELRFAPGASADVLTKLREVLESQGTGWASGKGWDMGWKVEEKKRNLYEKGKR